MGPSRGSLQSRVLVDSSGTKLSSRASGRRDDDAGVEGRLVDGALLQPKGSQLLIPSSFTGGSFGARHLFARCADEGPGAADVSAGRSLSCRSCRAMFGARVSGGANTTERAVPSRVGLRTGEAKGIEAPKRTAQSGSGSPERVSMVKGVLACECRCSSRSSGGSTLDRAGSGGNLEAGEVTERQRSGRIVDLREDKPRREWRPVRRSGSSSREPRRLIGGHTGLPGWFLIAERNVVARL